VHPPPAGLVARDAEMAELARQLDHAGRTASALVLLSGPAGFGKTALLDAMLARQDGAALRARAVAWECDRPGAVLVQLLDGDPPTDPVEAADVLVRSAGGEPGSAALVVVDDVQWADPLSLQALDSAVRRHRDAHLLVLLAAVTGDPTAPAAASDLLRRAAGTEIPLAPLPAAGVGQLAAAHGVLLHPSMAERLCTHTAGSPRHVLDLLREVPRATWAGFDPDLPAPAAVASRVREALVGCSRGARRLAEVAAVLGSGGAVADAARLAGLETGVVEVLDEARAAGLVRVAAHGLTEVEPADPMVRAAVLDVMGPAAVAAASRRAADLVDNPVRRLQLLVAASPMPDPELADRLDALATERAAEGAWAAAASLLTDASRLTEDRLVRDRRLTRAVDALVGSGDAMSAAALVPEVESLRETPLRNAVLGYLAVVRGRVAEAEARLNRAWDLVNVDREPDVAALICQRYVLHALCRCQGRALVEWADRAVELARPDDPAAVESAAIRGLGLAGVGRVQEAVASYRDLAARVQHGAQVQRVTMGSGWLNLVLDEVDDARAELQSAVPTTYLGGSSRISLWARAWLARTHFLTGEWDQALRVVREATALLDRTGIVLAGPLLHWTAVQVHALRGDWDLADAALRRADAGAQDYEIMRVPACLARAQVAEAQADYAGVLRALRPLTQPWARECIDEPGQWPWADVYANALVVEGRYDEADAFLAPHEQRARERDHRSTRARLGYARGRLLGARGDVDRAREAFEASLAFLDDLPLRYDRARANFAYGQTLRRAGKRREADTVISTARDLYASLGAATYVARCERELRAGGGGAPRPERGVGELTPQEEAVTRLVARGLSNREVAAELFLSTKTVQYHLTRVYAKLGIRSRAELAALRGPSSGADHS
jgi:DNA-binding CsgD family transcriptional regulator